jgi:hypothetical protein
VKKPRIIFDRSAFHGENFHLLVNSSLLRLARSRQISVYHTASLIEETASLFLREGNRQKLRDQLPFIIEICKDRWLQPTEVMWRKELIEGSDEKQTVFLPNCDRFHMEKVLLGMAYDEQFLDEQEIRELRESKESVKQKSERLRNLYVEMRHEIGTKLKDTGTSLSREKPRFSDYVDQHLVEIGRELIEKHLDAQLEVRKTAAARWVADTSRYPYVTSFMTGMLYAAYYAMIEHNQQIDVNAQMDIEHLTYLFGTDVLVTNDTKFMKSAFNEIWLQREKRLMTTSEFVLWLEKPQ